MYSPYIFPGRPLSSIRRRPAPVSGPLASLLFLTQALLLTLPSSVSADPSPSSPPAPAKTAADPTIHEARVRAQMIQEAVHGALQIMHRDFFDPDDKDRIPSASLEDMFEVMHDTWGVELHWLGVNAKTMDSDHDPRDQFERDAVAALAKGADEYEAVEGDSLRHVTAILLHNTCLKCHVPERTSLEDRVAGLAVRMPLRPQRKSGTAETSP